MNDDLLDKIVRDISINHNKIIDDWCKAYIAQIYQETGEVPKPGDFILNQQSYSPEKMVCGYKYWFTRKEKDREEV